ncbi:unnamed protein product [Auanema sp. JU1783]|nr:unnamed protein product [Auanema sp. JU1783]
MSRVMLSSLIYLLFIIQASLSTYIHLIDKTPCCLDRITSATCQRIRQSDHIKFRQRCSRDADFALIQCCSTCFDRRNSNSSSLYKQVTSEQLLNPQSSPCWDRRGQDFCTKLTQRKGFWDTSKYSHMDCAVYPFAFRECRQSCGYCSAGTYISRVRYDYERAVNPRLCDIKTYFTRDEEAILSKKKTGVSNNIALHYFEFSQISTP